MAESSNKASIPTTAIASTSKAEAPDLHSVVMTMATQIADMQAAMKAMQDMIIPIIASQPLKQPTAKIPEEPIISLSEPPPVKNWYEDPNLGNGPTDEEFLSGFDDIEQFRGKTPNMILSGEPSGSNYNLADLIGTTCAEPAREVRSNDREDQLLAMMKAMQAEIKDLKKGKGIKEEVDWSADLKATSTKSLIPVGFVMPDLEKYTGAGDPAGFIRIFINAMRPFNLGEEAILHLFPRYLTQAASTWYDQIEAWKFTSMNELAKAMIEKFNVFSMLENPKRNLRNLKQGPNEKFRTFMSRWKEVALQTDEVLNEQQQITMILEGLNENFNTALITHSFTNLKKMLVAGCNLDDSLSRSESNRGRVNNRGRPEVSHIQRTQGARNSSNRSDIHAVSFEQISGFSNLNQNQRGSMGRGRGNFSGTAQNYPNQGQSAGPNSFQRQSSSGFNLQNQNSNTGQRQNFNYNYPSQNQPNNNNNGGTNSEFQRTSRPKRNFDELGMSLGKVFHLLKSKGIIEPAPTKEGVSILGPNEKEFCEYHRLPGHHIDKCYSLQNKIQDLIDNNVITKPNVQKNPMPAHEANVVDFDETGKDFETGIMVINPWAPIDFQTLQQPINPWGESETVVVKVDTEDITIGLTNVSANTDINALRSGVDFHPTFMRTSEPLQPANRPSTSQAPPIEAVLSEATKGLFAQLRRTNVNMSIWELLVSSQKHRQALMTELVQIQTSSKTSPEEMVNAIMTSKRELAISFGPNDLPESGVSHAKALYISMSAVGNIVPRVLIDNGSALNILPLRTAQILGIKKEEIPPSDLCVKGFDSSKQEVVGNVLIKVYIGEVPFDVEFCVIDIKPSYNAILGRPWIHMAGAIASTLHQKVKFENEGQIVSVEGETYCTSTCTGTTYVSQNDVEMSGFDIHMINAGLGRNLEGIVDPILPADNKRHYGLGYDSSDESS